VYFSTGNQVASEEHNPNQVDATKEEFNMIDGGIAANNPTYVGVTEALRHCGNDAANPNSSTQLLVLSLGTGRHRKGYSADVAKRWGVIKWLRYDGDTPLINSLQNASADMVDYDLSVMFKDHSKNYLRIQVPLQLLTCVNTCISQKRMFVGFLLLKLIQSLLFAYKLH
jgi:hypothetical protein